MDQLLQPESLICSTSDGNEQHESCPITCIPQQETCQWIQDLVTTDGGQLIILHRSKCCYLANAYAVGVAQVQQQIHKAFTNCPSTISAAAENLAPSLTALHLAMVEGEKFIRNCMKGSHWLQKALTLALSSEAIDVHFHDLLWSVSVVGAAVGQILGDCADLDNQMVQLNVQMGGGVWQILLGNDTAHMNHEQMMACEQQQLNAINNLNVDSRNGILRMYGLLKATMSETCADEDLSLVLSALEDLKGTVGSSSPSATSDHQVISRFANFIFHRLSNRCPDPTSEGKLPAYFWVDRQEFQILGSLGSGGYAPVYEVEWLGEKFAMKEFSHVGSMFGASTELFEREAAIQASLQHPNVVQLICCTESSDGFNCGLVMELMQADLGSFMAKRVKKGVVPPFSLPLALDIMLQIAKGMEYLHSKHIMHRDLKSFNVLVTVSGSDQEPASDAGRIRAKISDFGMSKAKYMSSMYTTMRAGTTYWRAPEVFGSNLQLVIAEEDSTDLLHENEGNDINAAKYTKKADVYSFAMVCYEILSGKIPFLDINIPASKLHQKLINGVRPGLPSSCPQILHSFIAKCWHADASQRPPFVEICRTLGYLKGVLLTLEDPMLSLTQLSDPLVEKLVRRMDIPAGANNIPLNEDHQEMCHSNPVQVNVQEVELENKGHTAEDGADMNVAKTLQTGDQLFRYSIDLRKSFGKVERIRNMFRFPEKQGSSLLCKHRVDKSELPMSRFLEKLGSCLLYKHQADKLELGKSTSFHAQLEKQPAVVGKVIPKVIGEFSFQEIKVATNNFSTELGKGGFGPVYKGRFQDGRFAAIKVASNSSDQGSKEFLNEVDLLWRVHHKNLVGLLGYCNDEKLVLVYEFMSNGSLFDCLHGPYAKASPLSWATRLRIMVDAAQGFDYLHYGCNPRIIHRDVKSSNILLNDQLEGKISDFGISRNSFLNETGAPPTALMGSMGYMDPEYPSSMKLTEKVDVYSFGVVLFEVVCGKTAVFIDSSHQQTHIVEWARSSIDCGVIDDIIDPSLHGNYDVSSVWKVLDVALACVSLSGAQRPNMSVVFLELREAERIAAEFTGGGDNNSLSFTHVNAR